MAYSNLTGVLIRRGHVDTQRDTRDVSPEERPCEEGHSEKVAICKPRREASRETNPLTP